MPADPGLPVRLIAAGELVLASSAMADSGLEHYRGSFRNPAMLFPLVASALVLGSRVGEARQRRGAHALSIAVGAAGLGFHAYNIAKRPGRLDATNLFYAAPIGAPAALILAGGLGVAAEALRERGGQARPGHRAPARKLALFTAAGILGAVAEAGLLHFRGAFHDPAMWLPVALPPLAALALARDGASGDAHALTAALLGAAALLGLAGAGFHAFGVSRNMGGWRNWRQNLLAGPPLPAPPAFTGLALAGIGAWLLMRSGRG